MTSTNDWYTRRYILDGDARTVKGRRVRNILEYDDKGRTSVLLADVPNSQALDILQALKDAHQMGWENHARKFFEPLRLVGIVGALEVDQVPGTACFFTENGRAVLRVTGLPAPVPTAHTIDVSCAGGTMRYAPYTADEIGKALAQGYFTEGAGTGDETGAADSGGYENGDRDD